MTIDQSNVEMSMLIHYVLNERSDFVGKNVRIMKEVLYVNHPSIFFTFCSVKKRTTGTRVAKK